MMKLSPETIEWMLHKEPAKKEELGTILRAIYTRYMRLYEQYFADIDALNDDVIAEMRSYDEETASLVKYYYLDIPADICHGIKAFEDNYTANLLGPGWHAFLWNRYFDFKEKRGGRQKNEKALKAEFAGKCLEDFYAAMDYIFRDGFGTGSKTGENVISGIAGLLFGKEK